MDPIVPDLLELFPDTMSVRAVFRDYMGTVVSGGTSFSVQCRLENDQVPTSGEDGIERVSDVQAVCAGVFSLTTLDHEYTLPARFSPRAPNAIRVKYVTDENGPHHEVVLFGKK